MIQIGYKLNQLHAVVYSFDQAQAYSDVTRWQNRNNWESKREVDLIAEEITTFTNKLHLGVDYGPSVRPRFDIILAPAVGDEVSMSFNGDSYPCGKIITISKTMKRITTDTGKVFYRKRQSGVWSEGTFCMIPGHVNERNPHF